MASPALILSRPDRVGDVIIATSCLEAVRRQRPDGPLIFVAREAMRPLLEGHPLLDGFVALPDLRPTGRELRLRRALLAKELGRWNADAIVHLHPDALAQSAAQLARIPRRIGYCDGFYMDRCLTERFPDERHEGGRHEADRNFDLLAPLGIRGPPAAGEGIPLRPRVHLAESWLTSLRIRFAALGWEDFDKGGLRYAVVNPTAHAQDLRWPAENFAWLARDLIASGSFEKIIIVGDRHDDPSIRKVRYLLGVGFPGLLDLSGSTTLGELGWLLRFARLLVSRNTGTTHLAAAVGCPTVELFGRLEPRYGPARWRALGEQVEIVISPPMRRRWYESRRSFWRRGHASIPRETVLAAARRLAGG